MTKFQKTLLGIPQTSPPIWFMRQAGRYHSHYQKLRQKHSFMNLCKNPELAAQVALGPVEDFDFDVSILFSDLLFPLEAMGMGLEYTDAGPKLGWHLNKNNLSDLKKSEDALPHLFFQKDALRLTRERLSAEKSLIGFVGSPWTLFTYAVQGRHDGGLVETKKNIELFKPFCEVLVPLLQENIKLQLEGGAEIVMLFDTAAGELSPLSFGEHVLPQLKKLAQNFRGQTAYYAKGTTLSHFEHEIFKDGTFAGVGFDHRFDLPGLMGERRISGFTQGNFDQSFLFLQKDELKKTLRSYLLPFSQLSPHERASWVCGLGHGVLPGTPEENIKIFINEVREKF